jgi:3-hydroxybutyryl-CoA dehydrogenase
MWRCGHRQEGPAEPRRARFIVNRLLFPFLTEAMRTCEEGLASAADIDAGARLGLGHRMGPLELADVIGLDVLANAITAVYAEFRSPQFRPPSILLELVAAGLLRQRTGRGFQYPATQRAPSDR